MSNHPSSEFQKLRSDEAKEKRDDATTKYDVTINDDVATNDDVENKNDVTIMDDDDYIIYAVDARPPFYITILFAMQQILNLLGGPVGSSFIIHKAMCGGEDQVFLSQLVATSIFVSGLCTFVQVSVGIRLPIVQGSSIAYIPVILSMMTVPEWKCPVSDLHNSNNFSNETNSVENIQLLWQPRMAVASGALIVASVLQVLLGLSGAVGLLMRYVGPLTISPTIVMIGFSVSELVVRTAQQQWGVAFATAIIFVICTTVLNRILLPIPLFNRQQKWHFARVPVFRLFPQIFAIVIGWIICVILTESGYLTSDPKEIGYLARTDTKHELIRQQPWISIPYPGRWGWPTFNVGIFFGMLAATVSSIIESVGDYCATARACALPAPPAHAINRGVAMEGLGSVVCGLLGTAHATTSYSTTIGFIPITGMASRITWQVAGVILMCLGVFGKFGAVLSSMPDPVVGGSLLATAGMIIAIGLSGLQTVNMKLGRNLIVLGCALMVATSVSTWIARNPGAVKTGNDQIDSVIIIFLSTSMLLAGLTGFILDNILPGSRVDRGFIENDQDTEAKSKNLKEQQTLKIYNPPWTDKFYPNLNSAPRICNYIPFVPCYK